MQSNESTGGEKIRSNGADAFGVVEASGLRWRHLSSRNGDLPAPGTSTEQTGAIVGDLAGDGVNGIVLSFRKEAPALVWYRRSKSGWDRYVIDDSLLTVEAGGAMFDIDGDGRLDLLFGADWQGTEIWWWKNPGPPYHPSQKWKRYTVKRGGAKMHHDQIFGDFKQTGRPQLVYWNQMAHKLFIADVPANPTEVSEWPATEIYSVVPSANPKEYPEGLAAADIEGTGRKNLIAGNCWFKYLGDNRFKPIKFAEKGGRIAAAHLIKGSKIPQIVISSGDINGPLRWYECKGDPQKSSDWVGHDLMDREMIHAHSLQIADIDGDGNLDIFTAEMAKWNEDRPDSDNPNAEALIFYGDGKGNFRKTIFAEGIGFHEARVADLDGDGRMDIVNKPYNWKAPTVEVWLQMPGNGVQPTTAAKGRHKIDLGLQLYSLRGQLAKDVRGTLALVREMHFTHVEVHSLFGKTAADFRAELDKQGLHANGLNIMWERFDTDISGAIKDAEAFGCEYVVIPWIPHEGEFTIEHAKITAAKFSEWGKKCSDAGLKFAYHPHGYEFRPYLDGTLFDVIAAGTRREDVYFELDVFWAFHAGADPAGLLQKYPDRFPLIHLKDLQKGVRTPDYTVPGNAAGLSVALGEGQLDFADILAAAAKIGVKGYYIEDESSESVEQIRRSIGYVRSLGY